MCEVSVYALQKLNSNQEDVILKHCLAILIYFKVQKAGEGEIEKNRIVM